MVLSRCFTLYKIHLGIILQIKTTGSIIASIIPIEWHFKVVLCPKYGNIGKNDKFVTHTPKNKLRYIITALKSNSHNFVKNRDILILQKRKCRHN